ncbi:MAG TPA: nuclear transport factor 2 family protein [Chthoniobacterales bacterium]|jgi:hypothetical protein
MKKLCSLAVITLLALAAGARAADKDAIIKAEKNVWQSIKAKNYSAFENYLSADFYSVYSDEMNDRAKEVAEVKKLDFKSYKLSRMRVQFIDKDAAIVTYVATYVATQNGKDASEQTNNASVWHKEGNDWRAVFHTDMPVKK